MRPQLVEAFVLAFSVSWTQNIDCIKKWKELKYQPWHISIFTEVSAFDLNWIWSKHFKDLQVLNNVFGATSMAAWHIHNWRYDCPRWSFFSSRQELPKMRTLRHDVHPLEQLILAPAFVAFRKKTKMGWGSQWLWQQFKYGGHRFRAVALLINSLYFCAHAGTVRLDRCFYQLKSPSNKLCSYK